MSEALRLLEETADRLFADMVTPALLRASEADGFATVLWQTIERLGFPREHALGFLTRRLWMWQSDFGAGQDWAFLLGLEAARQGADGPSPRRSGFGRAGGLWPFLVDRPGFGSRAKRPRARRSRPSAEPAD